MIGEVNLMTVVFLVFMLSRILLPNGLILWLLPFFGLLSELSVTRYPRYVRDLAYIHIVCRTRRSFIFTS